MPVNIAVRPFLFLLSFAFSSGFFVQAAFACSCPPPPQVATALGRAQAVFEGTVSKASLSGNSSQIEFAVTRAWKGIRAETVTITTARSSAACGFEFIPGRSYLVYAEPGSPNSEGSAPTLSVDLCSRTKPSEAAAADTQKLGLGEIPVSSLKNMKRRNKALAQQAGSAGCFLAERHSDSPPTVPAAILLLVACIVLRRRAR